MVSIAEKHQNTIDESVARIISRAGNSRGLEIADLRLRVSAALEKYVLRENENASNSRR